MRSAFSTDIASAEQSAVKPKPMRVAFVGTSGFPYLKQASVSRLRTIAELIVRDGGTVYALNRLAIAGKDDTEPATLAGVETTEIAGSRFRKSGFLARNFEKLLAPFKEWIHLRQIHHKEGIDVIHVYTQDLIPVLFYALFSRIFRIPLLGHYVEMRSHIDTQRSILRKINDHLLDGPILKVYDAFIAISGLLEEHIRQIAPGKPIFRIPPVCDFQWFEDVPKKTESKPYLLYCGSAAYGDVVGFILESWESISNRNGYELHLVVSGSDSQLQTIRKRGEQLGDVKIHSKLAYVDLAGLYKGALALLIPLRPTIQDKARFPQKCCEYLASGSLVITTAIGEMPSYFQDGENALVAKDFTIDQFGAKIQQAMNNPKDTEAIARKGHETGLANFNAAVYVKPLGSFLRGLLGLSSPPK